MSEALRIYTDQLKAQLPWFLILSVVVAALAYGYVQRIGSTFETHFSYVISLSEREQAEEYRFDGYYALQATDLFAATLAQWMSSPEIIVQALRQAEVLETQITSRDLRQRVQAVKTAPQLVHVTVNDTSAADAEKVARALQHVMAEHVARYHTEGTPELTFRVVPTDMWTAEKAVAAFVVVAGAFFVTLFLSVNVVILMTSFKQSI